MDITTAMRRHEERILRLANVTGIGIGEDKGRPVIKVFVSRKLPKSELARGQVVPASLDGYPTDVEEIGVVMAQQGPDS
jgi:hypothetical protein